MKTTSTSISLGIVALVLLASCATVPETSGTPIGSPADDLVFRALDIWEDHRQDEAIGYLEEAMRLSPDAATAFLLSERYRKRGDLQATEEALSRAIELNPQFARAHYTRGTLRLWEIPGASKEDARADLARAHELDPSHPGYADTYAQEVRWDEGGVDKAAAVYRTLIEHNPTSAYGYLRLGALQAEQGNLADAEANFYRAAEHLGSRPDPYLVGDLAVEAIRWGQAELGRTVADLLLADPERDPWALAHFASRMTDLGEYRIAVQAFNHVDNNGHSLDEQGRFHRAISHYLENGDSGRLEAFLTEASDEIYRSAAAFALADSADSNTLETLYGDLERALAEHWGKVDDKRQYHAWLDDILTRAGR